MNNFIILAINTGSTSTKAAVYRDDTPILELSLSHSAEELAQFGSIPEQAEWRKGLIIEALKEHDIALDNSKLI